VASKLCRPLHGETLSTCFLSQTCGQWGLPHEDIIPWIEESKKYWDTQAAVKGLHKAMIKMKWQQCTEDDTDDEGGDRMKRPTSATGKSHQARKRSRGGSEKGSMDDTSRSPGSTSTGSSSKSSPS
jgi:hypothetical protein